MMRRLPFVMALVLGCSGAPATAPPDAADAGADLNDVGGSPDAADLSVPADAAPDLGVQPDGPVEVVTTSGVVVGEREDGLTSFLGIPYARPPLGPLRWAPPEPLAWTEPYLADGFGPRCLQPNIAFTSLQGDEDCLTLNVWTKASASPRPVMVWFHGGSFVQGSASEKTYHGHDLALHDVVVVTANYRLGALGYLAHRDLDARNFGLQDQLAVLDWVRANAEAFGGDPTNVTVFGESAGGISACLMVAAGHGTGRFERAISQSGPCTGLLALPDLVEAQAQGDALATAVGCDGALDALTCLRNADAETITSALGFRAGVIFGDGAAWVPVRDDDLVPVDVEGALSAAPTPMLMGANADEGSLVLVGANQGVVAVDYATATAQMFPDDIDAVRATYPLGDYPDDAGAIAAIVSDRFVCGTRRVARLRVAAGHPTWSYHFAHPFITPIGDLGAMHGAELPFVFGTELALVKLRDDQQPLSELMQRYWTRFAATGNPDGDGDPAWPAYSTGSDQQMLLDTQPAITTGVRTTACDFWDGIDG